MPCLCLCTLDIELIGLGHHSGQFTLCRCRLLLGLELPDEGLAGAFVRQRELILKACEDAPMRIVGVPCPVLCERLRSRRIFGLLQLAAD